MHLASDYIHPYKDAGDAPPTAGYASTSPTICVTLSVVVCSGLPNDPGGSSTNSAEVIAARVIRANELLTVRLEKLLDLVENP
jgi:hypothetical protein